MRAPCEVSIYSLSQAVFLPHCSSDLSCLCPGSPLVRMSSTIAQVRVIESRQLYWVLHRNLGTFCGSNMKLVAK